MSGLKKIGSKKTDSRKEYLRLVLLLKKIGFSLDEIHNMDLQTAEGFLDEFIEISKKESGVKSDTGTIKAKVFRKKIG
jgi:hypothetical protein